MLKILNKTRKVSGKMSVPKQIMTTFFALLFGGAMGIVAKLLEVNKLPSFLNFLNWLDWSNFLGRMALWIFIAVCLAVFSKSPLKAGINVFAFFVGMLIGYYVWTSVFTGHSPAMPNLMRWLILAVVSPFLAFLVWYARGRGALAIGISSVLIAIFCCLAFNLNFADFRIVYIPEFILWLASIGILFKDVKQSAFSLLISIPVALSLEYTGLLGIIGIG